MLSPAGRLYAFSKEGLKRVFGLKKSAHHLNEDEEETRMEVGNDGRGLCPVTLMHGAGPNHLAQEMVPGDMILELKILLRPG